LVTVSGAIVITEVCNSLITLAAAYPGSAVDWWVPPNVMACLCRRVVGVSCLQCLFASLCGLLCWLLG
jgi:hypothetical protein